MLRIAAWLCALLLCTAQTATAVDLVIDYTYANSFFSPSTANGRQARATVEAAAGYFSSILDDTLAPIATPAPYVGQQSTQTWSWEILFNHPSDNGLVRLSDTTLARDEYRIYVGAKPLASSIIGIGGPGGSDASSQLNGPGYLPNELAEVNAITAAFNDSILTRGGQAGDFSRWGGSLTLNSTANWHYNHTTPPTGGRTDLFSVALHELGHAIGFSGAEFRALRSGTAFTGTAATAANGGTRPRLDAASNYAHWASNTQSTVYGSNQPQEAAMDPTLTIGTRKRWTTLDAAGLSDIGWDVIAPVNLPGDYNADGLVDAADYTTWRDNPNASGSSYSEWRASYGSGGAAAASRRSIPEPGGIGITALLLAVLAPPKVVRREVRA